MPQVKPKVELLCSTAEPEKIIALAAKLCYSHADIAQLREGVSRQDISKYIASLIAMGHLSPVEHASFTFGIEGVSRALLAQITRHRIASFSVQSQRYVRAGRQEIFNYIIPPSIQELGAEATERFTAQMAQMQAWYNEWLELLGDKGEESNQDARFVLPNACETKMVVTMNARELMHFFSLRCCNRAQWEIRYVAWEMYKLAYGAAPYLFEEAGPSCIRGACAEGKKTCGQAKAVREFHRKLKKETENIYE